MYYNCTTLVEQEEIEVNDGAFPLFVKGVRIAEAGQLKGFRDYYRKISHTDTPRIMGDAGVKTFFIVSGSGPVTYKGDTEGNNTAGTVIVAPGQ